VQLAVGTLGAGAALALGGAAAQALPLALVGGVLAGAAVVVLVATGAVPGSVLLALGAPLPAVYDSPELRIAAVAPLAAAVMLGRLLGRGMDAAPMRWGALPRRALLALVAAVLLATLFADDPLFSAREALNFFTLVMLLMVLTDELAERPALAGDVVGALVISGAVCGVLAVLQALGTIPGQFPRWGTRFQRAALGFGQPNALGLFQVMVLPLAAQRFSAARGMRRALAAAALGATALGLAATFSRSAWLALLAGISALALAGRPRLALRALVLLLLGAGSFELLSGGMLSDTVARTVGDWVVEQRAALLLAAVRMFTTHPLLGLGPGGFAHQVEAYAAQVTMLWDYQATPHDAFIQFAAEDGIIGLLAFLAFVAAGLLALRRLARAAVAAEEAGLRLALLASVACLWATSFGIWPFSHGTGEAAVLVLALGFSRWAAGATVEESAWPLPRRWRRRSVA
jgi:O-antigen ligase